MTKQLSGVIAIQSLSFWAELPHAKQEILKSEVQKLGTALAMHRSSGLAMGQHLRAIYNTCQPYSGAFRKIAQSFQFRERTAYRYMETWDHAQATFPEPIIKAAMNKGVNFLSYSKDEPLGKYTPIVKMLPPPKNPTQAEADRYIDNLEAKYVEHKRAVTRGEVVVDKPSEPVIRDKQTLLKMNYRGIRNALKVLPARQRQPFLDSLFGMALTEMGVTRKTAFAPCDIPDDFQQGPGCPKGRPRTIEG